MAGAPAASGYGEQVTAEAAAGLVDRAFSIASGAAYGIEGPPTVLHSAAARPRWPISPGDRPYPPDHDALIRGIHESGGAVVSGSPCGWVPLKVRFLQRKRQQTRPGTPKF